LTKQIDNFTITDTADKVVVDYNKTLKDWFDTLITLAIGLFLSVATYFLLKQGFKTTSYIVIAAGLVFAFQAVLQSASGLSRLLQPTKNLLIIDKNTKKLFSKYSPFTSKTLFLDDIQTLIVSGQKEKLFVGSKKTMTRTYCTIKAKLKDKEEEKLFTINTNRFLRTTDKRLKAELYLKAKRLTTELNNYLKSKYQWTGYTVAK
jgi:hypothetical protein